MFAIQITRSAPVIKKANYLNIRERITAGAEVRDKGSIR